MNAKRVLQCALVFAMPLGLLSTHAPAADNAAAIKEFGIEKSEPIDKGFFFWNYRYVEAPYVVERRGLDVYISGRLVSKAPEWPPYDRTVREDPGDPPPGTSPLDEAPPGGDPRDTYWSRKWRYLAQHYDTEKAREKMILALRRAGTFQRVTVDRKMPWLVRLVDKTGKETNLGLEESPVSETPDRDTVLLRARKDKEFFERGLRSDALFVFVGTSHVAVGRRDALAILDLLRSDKPDEERIVGMEDAHFLELASEADRKRILSFKASARLQARIEKLNRMKGNLDKAKPRRTPAKDSAPPAPRPKTLSPEEEQARAGQAAPRMLDRILPCTPAGVRLRFYWARGRPAKAHRTYALTGPEGNTDERETCAAMRVGLCDAARPAEHACARGRQRRGDQGVRDQQGRADQQWLLVPRSQICRRALRGRAPRARYLHQRTLGEAKPGVAAL